MALSKKQRQKLKQADKRRSRRPEPTITIAPSMKFKASERNRLTNTNAGLMLSLETLLIEEAERNVDIDDGVLATSLRCAVRSLEPKTETTQVVTESLQRWLSVQDDVQQGQLAMRIIHESIQTRSDCQPGTYSYILYASKFLKKSKSITLAG